MEYRANGTVRMGLFGGAFFMEGSYRFIEPNVIEIEWGGSPSPDAESLVGTINENLTEAGAGAQVRIVQKTVLQVTVTDNDLKTIHLEKGRVGHFRRTG
jgi:hypothetical protein